MFSGKWASSLAVSCCSLGRSSGGGTFGMVLWWSRPGSVMWNEALMTNIGRHRAHGGHQRLAQHLAAVDPLPALLRAAAAKQVLLQRLQVQNGEQTLERAAGLGFGGLAGHWRHLAMVVSDPPGL